MHPLIAFLSFIFSPADDWLLTQAFELMIDPNQIPAVVESYERIGETYPSIVLDASGNKHSADSVADAQWAEILTSLGYQEEAASLLARLDQDPSTSPELRDDVKLRLGESLMKQGKWDEAKTYFQTIIQNPSSPRSLDARINLLVLDLAKNDLVSARRRAEELTHVLGPEIHLSRGLFPLGLTAFSVEEYDNALKYFALNEQDFRSRYFAGLAHRRMGRPREALAQWQELRKPNVEPYWMNLAGFQVAETYFALGDDTLSRVACEQALKDKPTASLENKLQFRLAAIDVRSKNFEGALARLGPLLNEKNLSNRASILAAESLIKTGQSKDLLKVLAQRRDLKPGAESTYQTAWAALYQKDHERAMAAAMEGLENFYDVDYTPRLLLLQGLAFEHMGYEAEALATFQTVADSFPGSPSASAAAHWTVLAYMRANRWREAVTHGSYLWNQLEEASKRSHPDTAFWLAEAHLRLKRDEDSKNLFDTFLALAPIDHALRPYGQFESAVALARLNQPREALAMLDQFMVTAKDRNQPSWLSLAQLQRGHIFFNDKQYAQAISAYRSAEKSAKSMFHEGLALYRLDYFSDAVDIWVKLNNEFPKNQYAETALFRAGRTQFELGLATQSVATFTQFVKMFPNSANRKEAQLQAAHALYNAGDVNAAAPLYSDFLARYHEMDDLVSVTPYLASCYAQLGKSANEIESLLKGLPPTDTVASLLWNEGAKEYNEKKYTTAGDLFASMLSRYPAHEHSATALFYRGESLFLQQKWQEAEAAFHNYLNLFPDEKKENAPLAMFHQGVSVYNQDQLLRAGEIFMRFLDQFPNDKLASDAKENLYLCYHNLGDWTTAEELKKKYSSIVSVSPEDENKLANSEMNWGAE